MIDCELDIMLEQDRPGSTKGLLTVQQNSQLLHCDVIDVARDKDRTAFVNKLHKLYPGVSADEVRQYLIEELERILTERRRAEEERANLQENDPLYNTPPEIKDDALAVLKNENIFEQISCNIASIGVAGEDELCLTIYLVMTSRLLEKPLSVMVQGASASGKSFIIETIAKLMPPEEVVQAHDFTDQVFYYMDEGSLQHKIVISGERLQEHRGKDGEAQDNTKAFREMVGSGYLRKAVTIKVGGQLTSKIIEQPGPIAYIESTTATTIHDEDATRLLPLVTDESTEQTEMVIEVQKREAKGQKISAAKQQEIIRRHHTMQRLLRPLAVRIPFADSISLPKTNIATRRTFGHLVSMIESVAILRQHQKDVKHDADGVEYLEACADDYRIVYQLIKKILSRTYSPLNQKSRDLLDILMDKTTAEPESMVDGYKYFTNQDCQNWTGLSEATVRRRLGPLAWTGIVTVDKSSKPYKYRIEKPELAESIDIGLPDPDDIEERVAIMSV
ncbi:MAG: hypothetical protein ACFFCW_02110 [Candidatus Hodarchaeota archaeon]